MLIALTGTIGSGKNTVADYLVRKHGFVFASGSEIIATEVRRRMLPVTRENMRVVANEFRSIDANSLIDLTISKVIENKKASIGFLRTENEVKRLKETQPNALLIAIDAPVNVRYERIVKRGEEKDGVSLNEFIESENIEMTSSNPDIQNMGYCIAHADVAITNESSLKDLYAKVDFVLKNKFF